MSCVTLASLGSPSDVLQVTPSKISPQTASLNPSQVLIKMRVRPVNPADVFSILGVYPGFTPSSFPCSPGLEGMGTIAKTGSGVSRVTIGDRVVPFMPPYVQHGVGTWQDYLIIEEKDLVKIPAAVSDESAAQLTVNPCTVIGMLETLKVPQGDFVLQNAAGSTLGRQLIQVAKHQGIKTVNIVRRAAQIEELKALGADVIVSSEGLSPEQLSEKILQETDGKRPYGAVDAVGGESSLALSMTVRDQGHILLYGLMSGLTAQVFGPAALFRNVIFTGFWVTPYMTTMTQEKRDAFFVRVMDLLEKKIIVPFSGQKFPLSQVKEAVAASGRVARGGKILLVSE